MPPADKTTIVIAPPTGCSQTDELQERLAVDFDSKNARDHLEKVGAEFVELDAEQTAPVFATLGTTRKSQWCQCC